MKNFATVFKFEYTSYLKSKTFIIVTAVLLGLILIGGNIPIFMGVYNNFRESRQTEGEGTAEPSRDLTKAAVSADRALYNADMLTAYIGEFEWVFYDSFNAGVNAKIEEGEYQFALSIDGLDYKIFVRGSDMMRNAFAYNGIFEMVKTVYQYSALEASGLTMEEVSRVVSAVPQAEFVTLGKDLTQSFWVGYVMLFMLFYGIMIYGQYIAMSVVTEKTSKAMELLITSVKPIYLMFGKVIGAGLAGLTQFGTLFLMLALMLAINAGAWADLNPMVGQVMEMSASAGIFVYAIIFFLLGFFSFAFVYAALASTVSRAEDAQSAMMIPVLLMTGTFLLAFLGMMSPEQTYLKVLSYVPFTSPMVMFMRVCTTEIPDWQILLAVPLNIVYILASGFVCTKIYRVGVMLYGTKPSLRDLWRYVKSA
jgi:ABC-2 type transport system permease protein